MSWTRQKKLIKNGRILKLHVKIEETNFTLANIYNPNTEIDQVANSS